MGNLGDLSARFESNGDPGAIGFDSVGGFSYGMYQIAAKVGTMDTFLTFLVQECPDQSTALQTAGGPAGARAGTDAFKAAWKQIAAQDRDRFCQSQHNFILTTHYAPQAAKLKASFQIDLDQRSAALRDVVWSMAVQMGNLTQTVFRNALAGRSASDLPDNDLITCLYQERSKLDRYFPSSSPAVKQGLLKRYQAEQVKALAMLAAEPSK